MSEADKMFEELGFRKSSPPYFNDFSYIKGFKSIKFDIVEKCVLVSHLERHIDMATAKEIEAIYLKLKELGWIK